jgi:hypothetical protein
VSGFSITHTEGAAGRCPAGQPGAAVPTWAVDAAGKSTEVLGFVQDENFCPHDGDMSRS